MATQIKAQDIATLDGNIAMGGNKLTGLGNGSAATDSAVFGQIQYLTAPVQTVSTTSFSTTLSSFQTTNLSASITPSSTSNRIKITVVGGAYNSAAVAGYNTYVSLFRDSTNLSASGSNGVMAYAPSASDAFLNSPISMMFIDSPTTTSSVTYSVKIHVDSSGGMTGTWGPSVDQIMILEEIR